MKLGPLVRRLFGSYEREVAEAYRRIFIDLDEFAGTMRAWAPQARRILEVGCGEGAMTERIVWAYPSATVTAIDISPNVGRLFRAPRAAVTFSQRTVEDLAKSEPASFDLVVLSDVLHHVPLAARRSLLCASRQAMAPGGSLIFKDWVVSASPIHWLCACADRYLTGDDVHYFEIGEIHALLTDACGADSIRAMRTVRPWRNNVAVLVRAQGS